MQNMIHFIRIGKYLYFFIIIICYCLKIKMLVLGHGGIHLSGHLWNQGLMVWRYTYGKHFLHKLSNLQGPNQPQSKPELSQKPPSVVSMRPILAQFCHIVARFLGITNFPYFTWNTACYQIHFPLECSRHPRQCKNCVSPHSHHCCG